MRRYETARGNGYRTVVGVVTLCVVLGVVGPATAGSAGGTAAVTNGPADTAVEIEYYDDFGGGSYWPATEFLVADVVDGSFAFGAGASTRIRVRNADTGESITLSPESGEETYQARDIRIDPTGVVGDQDPHVTVEIPSAGDVPETASVAVNVTGDTGLFSDQVFAPYRVQVVDGNGTVLAETDAATHGIGYEEPAVRYNGSHVAVERHPGVEADWHVEFSQLGSETEMTNEAGTEFFVTAVEDVDFEETLEFGVTVYPDEADPVGDRIVSLGGIELDDGDYVDGPVVGDDGGGAPTRTLSSTTAAPGETVTVTLTATLADGTVSFDEAFSPAVASAAVESVTLDGEDVDPAVSTAEDDGAVVTLDDGEAGETATVVYTVTVPETADSGAGYTIEGTVTTDETETLAEDTVTVAESPLDGAAAEYDDDGDGDIDIDELTAAATDYATGDLGIGGLGDVATAYATA